MREEIATINGAASDFRFPVPTGQIGEFRIEVLRGLGCPGTFHYGKSPGDLGLAETAGAGLSRRTHPL
jgi:hypothetical protein